MLLIDDTKFKCFTFSGGERHVELLVSDEEISAHAHNHALIELRVQSADNIMDVLLLNEILRRKGMETVSLKMLYIPYARQDRATTPNTSRALKVFADLINSCNFEDVFVLDPHSMVAENVINNMVQIDVVPYLGAYLTSMTKGTAQANKDNIVLVSPDIGAIKKIERYAKELGIKNVIAFHKERDPATGDIKGIKMITGADIDLTGKDVVVVDDICDGGRTFIELIQEFKKIITTDPKSINLFVTHGIFSKGTRVLLDAGFDTIGRTDSLAAVGCTGTTGDLDKLITIKA